MSVVETWRVETADNLLYLPTLPANSVDAVVCDPPYGLSREPDISEVLTCWLAGCPYKHTSVGFMGKEWDAFVPGPETWREVYRVLKPGGHLLCFAGTRTHDLMGIALRLAGFELRDTIAAYGLQWLYGSGFPKSLDIGKALDKAAGAEREVTGTASAGASSLERVRRVEMGYRPNLTACTPESYRITAPATDDAKRWDGWGTAMKPAVEPILLCRKPLSERNVAANVLRWGTGGINVDGCRVGTEELSTHSRGCNTAFPKRPGETSVEESNRSVPQNDIVTTSQGRWPPNAVFVHSPSCRQIGVKTIKTGTAVQRNRDGQVHNEVFGGYRKPPGQDATYGGQDGNEKVGDWDCAENCPVAELDRQSGDLHAAGNRSQSGGEPGPGYAASSYQVSFTRRALASDAGSGGASRFFPTFRYQAKADTAERNIGLPHGERNMHPTTKPVELMQWLVRLVTPPGGLILDPFAGSGTTGMAALREGFRFVGVEKDPDHAATARLRIEGDAPLLNAPTEIPSQPMPLATTEPDHAQEAML